MLINITGHHIDVTPALRAFTEEKFDKLERHFDQIKSINVVFNVEKLRQIAEATVHVNKGELHATSESEDLYAAIDALIDKLERQLSKHKEKNHKHHD
ncbi:ribosome hibernation promoting factor [Fluoribacter gormanii]|uniref:Ribosome hibernation promoting factor n=1 Tax=Fluoribacter gormanii TaxID=464 RepID=A0A377GLT9_9GAMM|nr:ribosome hibernation promoting factor [Fluoribacter gormanii]KTD05566.1 ribosome-associated, sigma 54 modulation protein [Fluoribacter gormanii]MCW8442650.1 ribosome hibernation promoting factor [Fluoribacter gormanii]MCW8471125.1 ribosome hibernation promoting factor [Fluoribacter gormanii]SIQ69085.1 SSU ribosomal protein S30P /sigma 54 modulation protein [Fluoribacter gormanii]STO25741.1 ribosome hibernation promoting factor HPF [Fluoribacter gormanii]